MFDTSVVFPSLVHYFIASETHEKAYRTAADCIPCRGLPATWSDPIVEVPRRTRGIVIHPVAESLGSTPSDDAFHVDQQPRAPQKPIGTRPAAPIEIDPFDDAHCGYLPWASIQAVRKGTLTLQELLPADAAGLKVEAWLELADTFVAMGDFETAGTCIANVVKRKTLQPDVLDVEEACFSSVPAALPPLMPSTSTNTEASDDADDLQPQGSDDCDEDWAIIDLSSDGSPSSTPVEVGEQDGAKPNKNARLIPRSLGLRALASRFRFVIL